MTVAAGVVTVRPRGAGDVPQRTHVPPDRPGWSELFAPRSPRSSGESALVGAGSALEPAARVVIADHHTTSRVGIRIALEQAGFVVVAEAASGEDAAALSEALRPHACLMDADIPGGGIAAVRKLTARAPGTAVVILSTTTNEDDFLAAVVAGARGYLLKTTDPARLPVAVRAVVAGEPAFPRAFGARLLEEICRRGNSASLPYVRGRQISLTPRESEVVQLMREGLPTREIAAQLGISVVTVRRHVSAALRKFDAPDRQAAMRLLQRSRTTVGRMINR